MDVETITWLGHSSFRLEAANGAQIYIDPWLTNPNCPENERQPERVDVVALTHGHDDHFGETTLELCRRHRPAIVAINELSWWLEGQLGPDNDLQRMNKGGSHTVRGIRVSMTDARHSSSVWPDDAQSGFYVGEPAGFVFHLKGAMIYFAGDTDVFGDMALIRRLHQPDIAVLPIGDRATMGPRGAALALELLQPQVCVPCHYGTWPDFFTGTPDQLRSLTNVPIVVPTFGETLKLSWLLEKGSGHPASSAGRTGPWPACG
jgi:L-ascorbate metabolism protein UlaG (beta-lactamase superfamily)